MRRAIRFFRLPVCAVAMVVCAAGCATDGKDDRSQAPRGNPPPPVATIPNTGNPIRRERAGDVLRDTGRDRGPAELELEVDPEAEPRP
jgi:hypothetical protein